MKSVATYSVRAWLGTVYRFSVWLNGYSMLQGKMSGDAWEHIRSLDETENWHERNTVISKTDHQTYTNWARVSFSLREMLCYLLN